MSEGGVPPQPLSLLERMKRKKEENDKKRAELLRGLDEGRSARSSYSSTSAAAAAASRTSVRSEEKENLGCSSGSSLARGNMSYDQQPNSSSNLSVLQESQLGGRANKSAPGGGHLMMADASVLGASMMSGSGSNNTSKNTSGGSSGIDVPRDASRFSTNNSILSSFIHKEEEMLQQLQPLKDVQQLQQAQLQQQQHAESFSRPQHVPKPRSRVASENKTEDMFNIPPPPPVDPSSRRQLQPQFDNMSILRPLQQDALQPVQPYILSHEEERSGRAAAAGNGSFLRSKSAAAAMDPFATPAVNRHSNIFSGMVPRTPGYAMQTPSMHRHLSMSAMSLSAATRMVVNGKEYAIIKPHQPLGKGGSSKVYQAFDEETGATVAIKVVDLADSDEMSRAAFVNEVELLRQLQGSRHVITMHDYELTEDGEQLLVVMEKGDTDLLTYLKTRRNDGTPTFTKYWWEEMLRAVEFVHAHNVVHMDLKPANFLLVQGNLKLIDFGIASSIPSNKTSVMKDSQMGTLSYMSPESLMAEEHDDHEGERFKLNAKSDVWSLGCILYQMVYGKRPFEQYKTQQSKIKAITNPATKIQYDPTDDPQIIKVLKRCLVYDVRQRASVAELLQHPYLKSSAAADGTPTRSSPMSSISDHALEQLANKIQSYTPRTVTRKLKELVVTAQSKQAAGAAAAAGPKLIFEVDSPPATDSKGK